MTWLGKLLTITELGMLAYWLFAALVVIGLIYVPPQYMYSDYQNPTIIAWNWSFFPIDILFATTGLVARFGRLDKRKKEILAAISLVLMFCAGLMAISFWLIKLEFDPFWWGINLWLIAISLYALNRIWRSDTR